MTVYAECGKSWMLMSCLYDYMLGDLIFNALSDGMKSVMSSLLYILLCVLPGGMGCHGEFLYVMLINLFVWHLDLMPLWWY